MSKLTLKTEGDTHVIVTRRFAAPPEEVYRAHIEPKLIQKWLLGPDGWTMPVCIHAENGKPRCEVISTTHAEIPVDGATTAVAGRRGQQTWIWTNAFGSGYYRSVLGAGMLDAVVGRGYQDLSEPERLGLLVDIKAEPR